MAKAETPKSGSKTGSQTSTDTSEKSKAKPASATDTEATTAKTEPVAEKAPAKAQAATDSVKESPAKPEVSKKPPQVETAEPKKSAASNQATQAKKSEPEKQADAKEAAKPDAAQKDTAKPEAIPDKPQPPKTEKSTPAPAAQPAQQSRPFWPLVLGGVVAGAIGFLAAQADLFGQQDGTDDLRAALAQQQAAIESLQSAKPVDLSGLDALQGDVATLSDDIAGLKETLAQLETRISAAEMRPIADGGDPEAAAAYAAQLAELKSSVESQKAEITTLLSNARTVEEATADAARLAAGQSALARITSAIGSGASFSGEMAELNAAGVNDLPEALKATAADGVVTLANLQSRFPDAARAALSAARATGADGSEPGLGSFLRRQLGARSVTPREGNTPDAILSRADAAVRNGLIADALLEIDALPEESQTPIQTWITDARARVDAQDAVQTLSQSLSAN